MLAKTLRQQQAWMWTALWQGRADLSGQECWWEKAAYTVVLPADCWWRKMFSLRPEICCGQTASDAVHIQSASHRRSMTFVWTAFRSSSQLPASNLQHIPSRWTMQPLHLGLRDGESLSKIYSTSYSCEDLCSAWIVQILTQLLMRKHKSYIYLNTRYLTST